MLSWDGQMMVEKSPFAINPRTDGGPGQGTFIEGTLKFSMYDLLHLDIYNETFLLVSIIFYLKVNVHLRFTMCIRFLLIFTEMFTV